MLDAAVAGRDDCRRKEILLAKRGRLRMIQVKRLGHATFTTTDLEKQIAYWCNVIGLSVVDKGKDHCILATRGGQECIGLERATVPGHLQRLSFK
jgi:catechol-2,3-dioxygenase